MIRITNPWISTGLFAHPNITKTYAKSETSAYCVSDTTLIINLYKNITIGVSQKKSQQEKRKIKKTE